MDCKMAKSASSETSMQERKSPSTMGSAAGSTRARTSSATSWQEGKSIMGVARADVTQPISEGNSDSHASATPAKKERAIRKNFRHEEAALLREDLPHNISFFRIYHQGACLRKLYLRYQLFKRGLLRSTRFGEVLIETFQIVGGHGD